MTTTHGPTIGEAGPRRLTPGVVAVLPARWGSTRFPGKALAPLLGRPLIQWVVERVLRAKLPEAVVVATDDERIAVAARDAGALVAMTRSDHPSGTDRVAEAVGGLDARVIINVQGDEPLMDPALVDELAASLMSPDSPWDMATAATPILRREELLRTSVVKVVTAADGGALYFSRSPIPHQRDATEADPLPPGLFWRHMGVYGYRRPALERLVREPPCALERAEMLEQLRALHLGLRIRVLRTADAGLGVDVPEDVARVEQLMRNEKEAAS